LRKVPFVAIETSDTSFKLVVLFTIVSSCKESGIEIVGEVPSNSTVTEAVVNGKPVTHN